MIGSEGYRLDPRNVLAIEILKFLETANELYQLVYCCKWMSTCIPYIHGKAQPLIEILQAAYKIAGKRKHSF